MLKLIPHIRKIVLLFSTLIAVFVFAYFGQGHEQAFANYRYAQFFALLAFAFLFLSLLPTPLYVAFPRFPLRALFVKARRAIGVSAFFFALLHVYFGLFKSLGGLKVLLQLSGKYQLATSMGIVSLIILAMLAATSFSYMVKKLGQRWKQLHRFIYAVALMIPIHALILGSHFNDHDSLLAKSLIFAWLLLLMLEEIRVYKYLTEKFTNFPRIIFSAVLIILFVATFYLLLLTNLFSNYAH